MDLTHMKKKPFSEKTIEQARIAAGFKCCMCRVQPCFHTHHLDPLAGNDFENAAPLCPTCHDRYGNDPSKQKFIRQSRDDWYRYNKETRPERQKELELNKEIFDKLEALEAKTVTKEELLHDLIPKIVDTLSSMEEDLTKYAKEGNFKKYIQSLSTLGSTATYSSGQITTVKGDVATGSDKETSPQFFQYPSSIRIYPLQCSSCGQLIHDQRFTPGSLCPFCGGILR
jgi:hypothetical protein